MLVNHHHAHESVDLERALHLNTSHAYCYQVRHNSAYGVACMDNVHGNVIQCIEPTTVFFSKITDKISTCNENVMIPPEAIGKQLTRQYVITG